MLGRRELLLGIAAASLLPPAPAKAQNAKLPVIGFMNTGSPYEWEPFISAFRLGLGQVGFTEGRNISIEFRWMFGQVEQSEALARDLVARGVDLLVTTGGNQPTLAAMRVTKSVPVLATFGDDPVRRGMVASLDHPGGNVSGVSLAAEGLERKQFVLLRDLVPRANVIAVLVDPLPGVVDLAKYQDAARSVGQQIIMVNASTEAEIDKAFTAAVERGAGAMLVTSTAYFIGRRDRLAALAARASLPTMYPARPYVDAGGLMSYGVDREDAYHQLGFAAGRLLRGEVRPAELPVHQPTKFELAINNRSAKAMGLTIPGAMLALANVVIQ